MPPHVAPAKGRPPPNSNAHAIRVLGADRCSRRGHGCGGRRRRVPQPLGARLRDIDDDLVVVWRLHFLRDYVAAVMVSPVTHEPELTEPVGLCRADGTLNPGAVGWARRPLIDCALPGSWGRRKRWDFWCVIGPGFAMNLTLRRRRLPRAGRRVVPRLSPAGRGGDGHGADAARARASTWRPGPARAPSRAGGRAALCASTTRSPGTTLTRPARRGKATSRPTCWSSARRATRR